MFAILFDYLFSKTIVRTFTTWEKQLIAAVDFTTLLPPWWNSSCLGEGAARRTQLSVAATTVRFNGFSQLQCQGLSRYWLDKIRKVFSSTNVTPPGVVSLSDNICPSAESERFPRLVRRNVAMLHPFTVWTWKVLSIIALPRSLVQKYFLRIPSLSWTATLQLFFVQWRDTFNGKGNKTHTHKERKKHTKSLNNPYEFLLKSQFTNKILLKCFKNR